MLAQTLLTDDKKAKNSKAFVTESIDELLDEEFPEQEWLVDGLIPARAITIVSAPAGSYKTRLMAHLSVCLAQGGVWFDKFETQQSGVLFIDEENGRSLLQRQLKQVGASKGLKIRSISRYGVFLNNEIIDQILLSCRTYELGTVIFDSLSDLHNANENDAIDMTGVFKHFQRLASENITVLILHHNRKPGANSYGGSNEMRGSTAIPAAVDSHITLAVKRDGIILVQQPKSRYSKPVSPFELQVVGDNNSLDFEYLGIVKKEDKEKLLREGVTSLLKEHNQLFQAEILEKLQEQGVKTNEHKLRELLEGMIRDKALDYIARNGNTKYYFLMA